MLGRRGERDRGDDEVARETERRPSDAQEKTGWRDVERAPAFKELMRRKNRFVVPATAFAFAFYMVMIALSGFTTFLDGAAIGAVSWAALFATAQFAVVWILCHVYRRRASEWDSLVEAAKQDASEGRMRP